MLMTTDTRSRKAFLFALAVSALIFIPFIVYDRGFFIYYGDFNVQQIPFYKLAHEAVRSGNVFWSFYTDLGANFIGSYSFYLLFSPFFWLTLPFPTAFVPHLMAPLLILKTACSALTAYLYLERFVKDRDWAVFGGILYAFSGWMFFNVFFNHFHEVAVFFPLLLLGVEKLVCDGKKGFFAACVALCAVVNYWFFVGEVVFVIIYVFVRMTDKRWGMNLRKFLSLALESVLGVGLAAVVLVPSVLALMGNPRTGADSLLTGWNLWLYWNTQSQASILQSLFFPPELPARLNFFSDTTAPWSSRSAWLPLVGLTGVLGYFFERKNDWVKKLLALCLVFALVPGLNSMFILFNQSYYARWFYMPILIMCMATARSFESSAGSTDHLLRALKWCMIITLGFIVACGLTPHFTDGELRFGMAAYPNVFWVYAVSVMTCLLLLTVLLVRFREHPAFKRLLCGALAFVCAAFGIYYIAQGKNDRERSNNVINTALGGRELVHLPDDDVEGAFSRIDFYEGTDNMGMFWHRPTIQAFHSIVPASIMEFYPMVGVERDVGSRPESEHWALRTLLSARWLFADRNKSEPDDPPVQGFEYRSEQLGFNLYENTNFIPMGFGYEYYLPREDMEEETSRNARLMLKAVVIDDWDAIARYDRDMLWFDTTESVDYSYDAMVEDAAERRALSCYYFAHDNRGFTARSNLEKGTLMFFSVPWEKGWSATVNGEPAIVEKVNIGFMAVWVPAGEAEIRFHYVTPGLKTGALITGGTLLVFMLYLICWRRNKSAEAQRKRIDVQRMAFLGEAVELSWEEYLALNRERARRFATMKPAEEEPELEEGGLPPEDRTLPFAPQVGEGEEPLSSDKRDKDPEEPDRFL